MNNISTIYRFYTPFLDIESEKNNLWGVLKKVKKSLEFDWIKYKKNVVESKKYLLYSFVFEWNIWKIDFYYIKSLKKTEYYHPIFRMDIFLDNRFLSDSFMKRTISFLTNIYECFDWLNEKEYLMDLNSSIYYKAWRFTFKKYPHYDFLNLDKVREEFESKSWVKILQDFIIHLQKWDFILTKQNSGKYHTFYGVLLYFLYLVYIMGINIAKTSETLKDLEKMNGDLLNVVQVNLMKKRLAYVDNLNVVTYKNYKSKLEVFFNLLD